jgi:hypothetical protein
VETPSSTVRSRATCIALAGALAVALLPAVARAAPTEAEKRAAAEALFEQAKDGMKQGDFASACPKLEEVNRILPGKIGALMKLGECYESAGKLARAKTALEAAHRAALAAADPRAAALASHVASLAARVPSLVVVVPPAVRSLRGVHVERDGLDLDAAQWDAPVPVDPGRHAIRVSAEGHAAWSTTVDLVAGAGVARVEVPVLADASTATPTPPAEPSPPRGRAWPWAVGGVGVALLGVAAGVGADGLAAVATLKSKCGSSYGSQPCATLASVYNPTADNARKDRDLGLFIGFGAGGVAAVTAAIVGLASRGRPDGDAHAATLTAEPFTLTGGGGLRVRGAF